jgi:hypothetical protein
VKIVVDFGDVSRVGGLYVWGESVHIEEEKAEESMESMIPTSLKT